jgi:Protein  of unknown function (DUF3018)
LRPIQIRVPDVRSPAFKAEAHREALAVAGSTHADEDQRFGPEEAAAVTGMAQSLARHRYRLA